MFFIIEKIISHVEKYVWCSRGGFIFDLLIEVRLGDQCDVVIVTYIPAFIYGCVIIGNQKFGIVFATYLAFTLGEWV